MIRTAILVDGAFYRKRAYNLFGDLPPAKRAKELSSYCHRHIKEEKDGAHLYRVFYYDCPPISKKIYHPLLKRQIDLSQTDDYIWANDFFKELKHQEICINTWTLSIRASSIHHKAEFLQKSPESIKKIR